MVCKELKKEKLNETKRKNGIGFKAYTDNHMLYPMLYTPTTLPMMLWPGAQALVVSHADKIVISAFFVSSLIRNNILFS